MKPATRKSFSWIRLWQMVRKELKQTVRDPKSRPLLFVSPVIQMLLMGYAATTDVKDIRTLVVDHDRTAESRALVNAYESSGYFRIAARSDRADDAAAALDRGDVTIALTIPPGFARDLHGGRGAVVQALIDGADASQATVAQSYAGAIARQYGARAQSAIRPAGAARGGVELRSRAWFNPSLESRYFNVPAIMGVQVMMICLILTALGVVREREIGTLDQLLVSPIKPVELILGKTIPVLGIGFLHLLVYTAMALYVFGVPLRGSFAVLLLASALYVMAGLALGLLISTVSKTQQEAFMLLILFFLPAVMLSGFVSPIESMPPFFQWLSMVNPLRYFLEIVRGVFLKGIGVVELWPQYLALTALAAATLTTATRRFGRVIA
ncbi:MAG TPA: ABC transporter permease [Gemmatimonadaceae bacterium]|nr:ABC transporter permease [Gemmatimonadaceae bacterium]